MEKLSVDTERLAGQVVEQSFELGGRSDRQFDPDVSALSSRSVKGQSSKMCPTSGGRIDLRKISRRSETRRERVVRYLCEKTL